MTDEQAEECAEVYSEIFNVKNVPGVVKAFPGVVETLEKTFFARYSDVYCK